MFNPAKSISEVYRIGEFRDVNPSICDSTTYSFLDASLMEEAFHNEVQGVHLYSRRNTPTSKKLATLLAAMEGAESAHVTATGMSSIGSIMLTLCSPGDEVVSSATLYGGTFGLFTNLLARFNIKVKLVDINNLEAVKKAITPKTKVLYAESISNPLIEVANIPELAKIAKAHKIKLVIDNTFSPLIISPIKLGADVVVHSLTKFINGTADTMGGVIISSKEIIDSAADSVSGPAVLIGASLDSIKAASIMKNINSLHIRLQQHGNNALFLAEKFQDFGLKAHYPGLPSHRDHSLIKNIMNKGFGFGGMLSVDLLTKELSQKFMIRMQEEGVGLFALSLGYFKTLFCAPGGTTASSMPAEARNKIGIGDGLIRFSIGLDHDIENSWSKIFKILKELNVDAQLKKNPVKVHA